MNATMGTGVFIFRLWYCNPGDSDVLRTTEQQAFTFTAKATIINLCNTKLPMSDFRSRGSTNNIEA